MNYMEYTQHNYVSKRYGKAILVFDEYSDAPSTNTTEINPSIHRCH